MLKKLAVALAALVLVAILFVGYSFFKTPEGATQPAQAVPLANEPVATTYQLSQEGTQARFLIDEVLRGSDFTVVGVTDQVAGELAFDLNNPGGAEVGPITVNARTLATDSSFRDRALKNRILLTDDYEFVTFTPTELTGLPETVALGEAFSFQMTGDLTITDVTKPVTFDVTVTPVSETALEGLASVTLNYADFGIAIPAAQAVQAVADTVKLELTFTAAKNL